VPREIGFETKPEIALRQVRQAQEEGVPPGVVLGVERLSRNSA
jgi:SRSO17 transposase